MPAKAIGPSFVAELQAAGLLGLPFTWGPDGDIHFDPSLAQAQRDAVNAVYTAHDPAAAAPPSLEAQMAVLFPDVIVRNNLFAKYPLFRDALERGDWAEAATLMADAVATGVITQAQATAVAALLPSA